MFELQNIRTQIEKCTLCQIHSSKNKTVPGEGNSTPEIMLIGEAPGKNEDLQGKPFVGAAGKILDQLLSSIKLSRDQVFITNMIKCRPPNNRDPLDQEIDNCANFLNVGNISFAGEHGRRCPSFQVSRSFRQPIFFGL